MNRNVITEADINNLLDPSRGTPATLDEAPPAGAVPSMAAGGAVPAPGPAPGADVSSPATPTPAGRAVGVPASDDYLTKLLKYVPIEVLGAYLFVEDLVTSNVSDPQEKQNWLFAILLGSLVVSAVYARRVINVVRVSQIAMGALGLAVYVFSTGGWFGTTSWYEDWYSGIALVLFAFLVAVIKLPDLPVQAKVTPAPS
jgi:branched-subunit amino acid transport protein